jgi:hypothetical protein
MSAWWAGFVIGWTAAAITAVVIVALSYWLRFRTAPDAHTWTEEEDKRVGQEVAEQKRRDKERT